MLCTKQMVKQHPDPERAQLLAHFADRIFTGGAAGGRKIFAQSPQEHGLDAPMEEDVFPSRWEAVSKPTQRLKEHIARCLTLIIDSARSQSKRYVWNDEIGFALLCFG